MNEGDDSSKSPGLVLGMPPNSAKVPESKKELVKKTRIIEQLAYLATLIAYYHEELLDYIIDLKIIPFIFTISAASSLPAAIRSKAVFAISLLTENERLFDEFIHN